MPLVSVVLPTCDRGTLLSRAVASVVAQSFTDWELLIVDNNRSEPPVVQHPSAEDWLLDPRIRVLDGRGAKSAAAARNVGLGAAAGTWLSYLDDDDAWRPEKLAMQIALATRHQLPLVLCGARFHLSNRQRIVQCDRDKFQGDHILLHARWNTSLLLHRTQPTIRFDERFHAGEDAELGHRLLSVNGAEFVMNVPFPLVDIYPQTGRRVNTDPRPLKAITARLLSLAPPRYSRRTRRRFILAMLLAETKLRRRPVKCAALSATLMVESQGKDWRKCANAIAVSLGFFPDFWVS